MKPIRVLQVVHELGIGGIQTFIMNIYRNIDRTKVQFDFLLDTDKQGAFEKEIELLGGVVYRVTSRNSNLLKYKKEVKRFFKIYCNKFACIHCHWSNLSNVYPALIARKYGAKTIVIHSHSTNLPNNTIHKFLHRFNKKRIAKIATHFFACSDLAGNWLFPTNCKFEIIKNGVEVDKYKFCLAKRMETRKELHLDGKIVFASVGRFTEAKNHPFLLRLFNEIVKKMPNSFMLLAGVSETEPVVAELIGSLGLENHVRLLGFRSDLHLVLQAADVFLLPSKWEGFPVALIEAQSSGLPSYVSDTVTKQAIINNNVFYLSLNEGEQKWAEIISYNHSKGLNNRVETVDAIKKAGFDVIQTATLLKHFYIDRAGIINEKKQ